MGGGDVIQHSLQGVQIGEGLTAGEHEVAFGGDGVHDVDALADLVCGEACQIGVFPFVDTERTVIAAVVRDKDRDRSAALSCLVRMLQGLNDLSGVMVRRICKHGYNQQL